ncbi:MAG: ATP-binding cassette domain-containing protein [Comamonadaceae bacterium]|nr:ATP-binding cassette domain-containing protein [Comamonadaceae bacterium]
MAILEVGDLSAGYGNGFVVRGVSLAVEPGEFVAVLGRNGSGKSTLIKAVQNLLANVRGTVRCGGRGRLRPGPAPGRVADRLRAPDGRAGLRIHGRRRSCAWAASPARAGSRGPRPGTTRRSRRPCG